MGWQGLPARSKAAVEGPAAMLEVRGRKEAVCDRCCAQRWRLRSGRGLLAGDPETGGWIRPRRGAAGLCQHQGRAGDARRAGLEAAAADPGRPLRTRSPRTASFAFAACLPPSPCRRDTRSLPAPGPCPWRRCLVSASFCRSESRGRRRSPSASSASRSRIGRGRRPRSSSPRPEARAASPELPSSVAPVVVAPQAQSGRTRARSGTSRHGSGAARARATCLLRASSSSAPPRRDWRRARWPPRAPTIQTSWPSSASSACSPTSRRRANGTRRRASSAPPAGERLRRLGSR